MLKRKFSKLGELGSMMVEAMAMLGLISMVTPIVYKKAAERNMELQDVNAASQLRNIIKAVDEYITDNYGKITGAETVKNACPKEDEVKYTDFTANSSGDYIDIDIAHFCEYLPYGFLDENGDVNDNKIFNANFRVAIKKVESGGLNDSRKTLTGFVVASPHQGADFPRLRASRISSMIGGNGGYVENGEALGVQGMWGISNIEAELGLDNIENGAVIASSVTPISSGGSNDDAVLYRKWQANRELNTMETTLLMGASASAGRNIVNINQAVIEASATDETIDGGIEKALWLKNRAGAFVDGVLGVGANGQDLPAFRVEQDGSVKSGVTGGDGTTMTARFEVTAIDGAVKAADGKFKVNADGSFDAAINGDDGAGGNFANFSVDAGGNLLSKASGVFEKDLGVKGVAVVGSGDAALAGLTASGVSAAEPGFQLTVNDNAFIRGLLRVKHFKADNVDAGVLRAGVNDVMSNNNDDYTLIVDTQELSVGGDRFTVQNDTGDTKIKGGDLLVSDDADSFDLFLVSQADQYTYASGLRAGVPDGTIYPLEVANDDAGAITMNLKNTSSYIVGYDSSDGTLFDFNNDFSLVQKESGDNNSRLYLEDSQGRFSTKDSADEAFIEVTTKKIAADVTSGEANNNIELEQNAVNTGSADLTLRKSSSIKVFGENTGPLLYIDPEGVDAENPAIDRLNTEDSRGGVYIRRGVVDLESNHEDKYITPAFKDEKDKGYVRADMLISQEVGEGLDANSTFYNGAANVGGTDFLQYDIFMVNPAYTSVMHDIKLTSRGGARLSDILPDFINKGIYLADNTYAETMGDWGSMSYSISTSGGTAEVKGNRQDANDCSTRYPANPYECPTSPWLGVVPTPQCPPGYDKAVQVFPYGFNIAQAGVPGPNRTDFYIHTNPKEQYPDPLTDNDPYPLYFQKSTWLKTRAQQIGSQASFMGWYVLMGFVYPTSEWGNDYGAANIVQDTNNYYWNLFPVYYRELEAYSTVYCYFNRTRFDSDFVDTNYDQLKAFRYPTDKVRNYGNSANKATNVDRLDDPNLEYKNPW
ncbi:MAG: hypothetical protein LBR70_07325 [Lactobacillaceae bacterium]|jgi:hypothetical protein|nr:hypothetical protein [Lactobacillaceae bacterium]